MIEQLKQQSIALAVEKQELQEMEEALNYAAMVYQLSITTQIDDTGKPLYTNDLQRKAALASYLQDDPEYQTNKAKTRKKQIAVAVLEAECEYFRNCITLKIAEQPSTVIVDNNKKSKVFQRSLDT